MLGMDYSHKALREWRKGRRLTQKEVADKLGITRGGYANYEADPPAPIPNDKLTILKAMGFGSDPKEVDATAVELRYIDQERIPYIGPISAGAVAEWCEPAEVDDTKPVPRDMAGPNRFLAKIVGDSMFDVLYPDDLVVLHREDIPRIGVITLYRHEDLSLTVKQLKHDGKNYILHPCNPAYQDEIAIGKNVAYLVGIIRTVGSRRITIYDETGIRP